MGPTSPSPNSVSRFFEAVLVGSLASSASKKRIGTFMWKPSKREDLDFLRGLLESGRIRPLIDRRFVLGEAPKALRYLDEGCAKEKSS